MSRFSYFEKHRIVCGILIAALFIFFFREDDVNAQIEMPTREEFISTVAQNYALMIAQDSHSKPPGQIAGHVGSTVFLPMVTLMRGQDEISLENVFRKLREKVAVGAITKRHGQWVLPEDAGQSLTPLLDPIQVVRSRHGFLILDGHHEFFLSLFLGAKTIAAKVMSDESHLNDLEFWREMKASKLVYLRATAEELAANPPTMLAYHDNPNRYLAALLALKVGTNHDHSVKSVKGSDAAIWIKVNDRVPFIEFYIADLLTKAGIVYHSEWGDRVPDDVVEKARAVLMEASAARHHSHIFDEVPVIDEAKAASRARQDSTYLMSLLPVRSCQSIFKSGASK